MSKLIRCGIFVVALAAYESSASAQHYYPQSYPYGYQPAPGYQNYGYVWFGFQKYQYQPRYYAPPGYYAQPGYYPQPSYYSPPVGTYPTSAPQSPTYPTSTYPSSGYPTGYPSYSAADPGDLEPVPDPRFLDSASPYPNKYDDYSHTYDGHVHKYDGYTPPMPITSDPHVYGYPHSHNYSHAYGYPHSYPYSHYGYPHYHSRPQLNPNTTWLEIESWRAARPSVQAPSAATVWQTPGAISRR